MSKYQELEGKKIMLIDARNADKMSRLEFKSIYKLNKLGLAAEIKEPIVVYGFNWYDDGSELIEYADIYKDSGTFSPFVGGVLFRENGKDHNTFDIDSNVFVFDRDMFENEAYRAIFELIFDVNGDWEIINKRSEEMSLQNKEKDGDYPLEYYIQVLKEEGVSDPAAKENINLAYDSFWDDQTILISSKESILVKSFDSIPEFVKYLGYPDYDA